MRLSKTLSNAVGFAIWCTEHKVDPPAAGQLIALANRSLNAGVKNCNEPGYAKKDRKAGEKFEEYAKSLGFLTEWNGLYPTLHVDGSSRDIHLPVIG